MSFSQSPIFAVPTQAEAGPSKKRKSQKASVEDEGAKKDKADVQKRSQSCDVCRARKVKCVKETGADACEGCAGLGQTCKYTHERRKPGPANSFARKTSRQIVPEPQQMPPPWSFDSSSNPVVDFPDFSFLPISPQSLLHPPLGEDTASEDSPAGRWSWIPGAGDLWDDKWLEGAKAPTPQPILPMTRSQLEQATKVARLEDVAPFSTITRILQGYYAHLYALMPVVHWPSFSQQLMAREDERSDQWLAFVLSLVAYSIIQLPRSVLAFLPVRDLRRLHQRCHAESRKLQNRAYVDVELIHISTLYCDHIYLGTLGRTHLANVILAEAIRLAQTLNLHDERDQITDAIERETRRRVFWLLYGSDRTITALTSAPMHIQDCDLCLPLPLAIDDAYLTAAGAFEQPKDSTPLLAGFHFQCRVFRLLGAVQTAHRSLALDSILQLPHIPSTLRPSSHFTNELDRILQDLPGALQLVNPTVDSSGFAICRANLLISQAMVRFSIRQYARAVGENDEAGSWAEKDVLHLLESMSSESLAANGESLRRKVLFVASSLLEKYPSTGEGYTYVEEFFAVYTRISEEQHVALLDMSAAPSREGSPPRLPVS